MSSNMNQPADQLSRGSIRASERSELLETAMSKTTKAPIQLVSNHRIGASISKMKPSESLEDLINKTTDFNPQAVPLASWKAVFEVEIYKTRKTMFDQLHYLSRSANRYHDTHPLARSQHLVDPQCAVAQQLFGLEERRWDKDPFFAPLRRIEELLRIAEATIDRDWSDKVIAQVAKALLHTMPLVRQLVGSFKEAQNGSYISCKTDSSSSATRQRP